MKQGHTIIAVLLAAFTLFAAKTFAAASTVLVATHSYASSNVTTAAYVELVQSSPASVTKLEVCDTSGKLVKIASGNPGSEVDLFTTTISGCVTLQFTTVLQAGTRLSLKAIDANATTGYNAVSFLQ